MANYNHLCKEQRILIEYLLNKGNNFIYIAKAVKVDRTTIAKEIKRNRSLKSPVFLPFNKIGISRAINVCHKLSKAPYCCNNCLLKSSCLKSHLYYNATNAQKNYEHILRESREGINISSEEISIINKNITSLIKIKKQSVNQVYINHPDILYFSKPTFYKYINQNIVNLGNLDLPRKVKYKKRKRKNKTKNKRDISILKNRTFENFLTITNANKKLHIWQLDTVIGKISDKKVLMTFLLVETNFMIIRLLNKKDIENVDEAFDLIKRDLGIDLYAKFINVILTDNGVEFYDPIHMEYNFETGDKISSVFYCHPNSPQEKSELEKNHEYIRYVLPKKSTFQNLTKEQVQLLENNINNIPRDIFGNETPYNLTYKKYPELIKKFNSKFIKPDDVNLNSDYIFKFSK
jgi:IS30 family transposase